jgi:hypothetical protein
MNPLFITISVTVLLASLTVNTVSQKVAVGYDKSADFTRFKSYTWAEPCMPVTRPRLYETVIYSVDYELKSKGVAKVENNGDLILIPSGAMEFGLNQAAGTPFPPTFSGSPARFNATMWTGATGPENPTARYIPEGTLVLTFVDRSANKVIWTGTVSEKLDLENKKKSLERVDRAIVKLFKKFPPGKK